MDTTLYEKDFYLWTQTTAELLKQQKFDAVDWDNLIEEIETLGRSEKRAVRSHLVILLQHLLKWQFQPERRSSSWQNSIDNARDELAELLADNPSLSGSFLLESLPEVYSKARKKASDETTIYLENFPEECPYSLSEILHPEFLPERMSEKSP